MKSKALLVLALLGVAGFACEAPQDQVADPYGLHSEGQTACVFYVDGEQGASGSGRSWSEAFVSVEEAVDRMESH